MAETAQAALASTQAPAVSKTPVYEVGFHLVPTVGEDGLGAVVEKIRKMLGDAEIIKESYPVKMTLSYVIERATQGKREKYSESYFGWIKFATEREALPQLQATLQAMHEVMRFLVTETTREDLTAQRRAVFSSDRLEGKTLEKPTSMPEKPSEVSEAELDKSIEALTG